MAYQTVKSVIKAMKILELVMERAREGKSAALKEVAQQTGLLPVTARNLLRTLEECGYVRRSSHGRYEEGSRCFELLRSGGTFHRLPELARPILERAAHDTGEAFLLVTLANGRRVELLRIGADPEMRFQANAELYAMRTTRAILGWYPPEQIDYFVERNSLPSIGQWPECGNSREGLDRELREIRRNGGCCDCNGKMAAMAVPVFTPSDEIIGSLGCYAPLERTDLVRRTGIFKLLHDYAQEIQKQLTE